MGKRCVGVGRVEGYLLSLMVCGWVRGCMTVFLDLGVGMRLCVSGVGGGVTM